MQKGTGLMKYDIACQALAEAKLVDEVKEIRDRAIAMTAYAKQAKSTTLYADAGEIRARAERRLGEMIIAQKQTVGLATGGEHGGKKRIDGTRTEPSNARPTLAEAGIDKKLSARSQALAKLPPKDFEEVVSEVRAKSMERVRESQDALDWQFNQTDLVNEFAKRLTALMRVAKRILELKADKKPGNEFIFTAELENSVNVAAAIINRLKGELS